MRYTRTSRRNRFDRWGIRASGDTCRWESEIELTATHGLLNGPRQVCPNGALPGTRQRQQQCQQQQQQLDQDADFHVVESVLKCPSPADAGSANLLADHLSDGVHARMLLVYVGRV